MDITSPCAESRWMLTWTQENMNFCCYWNIIQERCIFAMVFATMSTRAFLFILSIYFWCNITPMSVQDILSLLLNNLWFFMAVIFAGPLTCSLLAGDLSSFQVSLEQDCSEIDLSSVFTFQVVKTTAVWQNSSVCHQVSNMLQKLLLFFPLLFLDTRPTCVKGPKPRSMQPFPRV